MFWRLLHRLKDDRGQDLIEYALLASVIALAGIVGFNALSGAMNGSYGSWDTSNWNIWQPPPPQ